MVIKLFKNFWFWAFIFRNFFDHNVCVQVWVCLYSWIHMTMPMSLFWYWWCQCLYSGIDSANVCILVMMVSMSVFWYWSLLASSITALGHFLLRQLGALCRLKCDSSICIPTRSAPSQFLLCTYSSISFPTLHCSSHSSTHCIVYPHYRGGVIRQSRFYIVCTWSVRSSDVIMVLMYPASHTPTATLFKSPFGSALKLFQSGQFNLFYKVLTRVCASRYG